MRIRSTKPEFWRSERIAAVSWDARLVLKGLESYVDDNGVGKDDLALIVADVFPRDLSRNPPGTLQKVSEAISDLDDAGLIWRYEANGTKFLYVSFWESAQRIEKPTRGRFPRPDGTLNYRESEIRESSPTIPVILPEPSGLEQRNRGTEEQNLSCASDDARDRSTSNDAPERFDEFWDTYAKKVDRKKAEQKYKLALKKRGVTADLLISSAQSYIDFQKSEGKHPQFTKDPATWLNNESWTNELADRRVGELQLSPEWQTPEQPPDEILSDPDAYSKWIRDRSRRSA